MMQTVLPVTSSIYNSQSKVLKGTEAEFRCMCYLELKSGSVSLTPICGQEEVPIRLLKTK